MWGQVILTVIKHIIDNLTDLYNICNILQSMQLLFIIS